MYMYVCVCVYIYIYIYIYGIKIRRGARCSSVVRAFAHSVMGHRIDPSWWTYWAISHSSQCSTNGITKAVVCPVCGVVHIKDPLLLIGKSSPCSGSSGYLNGPLPYVWHNITVNKNLLSASLNKTFPSFFYKIIIKDPHKDWYYFSDIPELPRYVSIEVIYLKSQSIKNYIMLSLLFIAAVVLQSLNIILSLRLTIKIFEAWHTPINSVIYDELSRTFLCCFLHKQIMYNGCWFDVAITELTLDSYFI